MTKTILITGSTDGIGLEAARMFVAQDHKVILHGRSAEKLAKVQAELGCDGFVADLSVLQEVDKLAQDVLGACDTLDVLINNAGVLKAGNTRTAEGWDIRFAVNTIAPYSLTRALLPTVPADGRILNLSSAAQAPVSVAAMQGDGADLCANEAYAQSKLAITMWSIALAEELGPDGPVVLAINPGSLLGTNMVKEGYGIAGKDISIGADILVQTALSPDFADKTGLYWDNDSGRFAQPHPDALDAAKVAQVTQAVAQLAGV